MTWRTWFAVAAVVASVASVPFETVRAGAVPAPARTQALPPPNILLVIADDFGVDTSPCYETGTDKPSMPALARLCADGLVFDEYWTPPECSPTRATILTGRYGLRTGVGAALSRSSSGLSTDELGLQRYLTQSGTGMASAVIGKWHLATDANGWLDHPARIGVTHFDGLLTGAPDSYSRWSRTTNGQASIATTYITSQLTDLAVGWIAAQSTPWFLWLAYTAPHAPLHLPPASLHDRGDLPGTAADIQARPLPYHFAMAEAMDRELGRLLDGLDPATRARTVVIFAGDNGTAAGVIQPTTERTRAKSTLYQGGIHTPLIVSGAGVTRAGQRESALVSSVDLFATIAQLAGSAVEVWRDSQSFAGLLTDASGRRRSEVYTEYFGSERAASHGWTIRDARYKLIVFDSGERRFYDLIADPGEQTDLAASTSPIVVEALARLTRRGGEVRAGG